MARRPVSTFELMFKKKVLPKKKQLEITDGETVIDIATYRYTVYSYGPVLTAFRILLCSVVDPDPSDPNVFGPPWSGSDSQRYGSGSRSVPPTNGSGSYYHQATNRGKTLIPTVLRLLFDFSLKNYVNLPSKRNKWKNLSSFPNGWRRVWRHYSSEQGVFLMLPALAICKEAALSR